MVQVDTQQGIFFSEQLYGGVAAVKMFVDTNKIEVREALIALGWTPPPQKVEGEQP